MDTQLIRKRLERVKDFVILNPGRFNNRFLVRPFPCVGCIAGVLDYLENGEAHWEHPLDVRNIALELIGLEPRTYPRIFENDIHSIPGGLDHAEAACKKIDEFLKSLPRESEPVSWPGAETQHEAELLTEAK